MFLIDILYSTTRCYTGSIDIVSLKNDCCQEFQLFFCFFEINDDGKK